MATRGRRTRATYEDYLNTPEGERYELLDGELVVVPSPNATHQRIGFQMAKILDRQVEDNSLGELFIAPFDVEFWNGNEKEVVQPDILFISAAREHILTEANVQGAPDLVVEILSPSTESRDRGYKRELYARHGVSEFWLVDPNARSIEVLLLSAGEYESGGNYGPEDMLTSPTLQGFEFSLAEIFGTV